MTLHVRIDPRSGVPVYRQLMDQLKYYIAAGSLQAGDQLPSIRELAELLTINPTTVVRAYSELAHERVVEMRHGKGAFVSEQAPRMSSGEREQALRRLAHQLVIESAQMGATRDLVLRVVEEELELLESERQRGQSEVKAPMEGKR